MMPQELYFVGLCAVRPYTIMPIMLTIVGKIRVTSESSGKCVPPRRLANQMVVLSPK